MKIKHALSAAIATIITTSTMGTALALPAWVPTLQFPYPGTVVGGERDIPNRAASRTTADGWVLNVEKIDEAINFAPALDGSYTTGEAFGTLTANSFITGNSDEPLLGAYFETGYQIGCGIDVSSGADVEVASVVGVSPSVGISPNAQVGVDAGVQAGPHAEVTLPSNTATVGAQGQGDAGVNATAGVDSEASVDARGEVAPTVAFHLNPGGVTTIQLAGYDMNLEKKRAAGGFTGAHLQVNGCVGEVSIRSYASLSTVTETSVDTVAVYGDARRIR